MKKKLILSLMSTIFILCFTFPVFASQSEVNLEIVFPSVSQSQIAPDRDFYVIGNIKGNVPNNEKLEITVNRDNQELRRINVNKFKLRT